MRKARPNLASMPASPLYAPTPFANPACASDLLFKAGGVPPDAGVLLQALAACEAATIVCLVAYAAPGLHRGNETALLAFHERLDRRLAERHRRHRSNAAAHPKSHFPDARQLSCQAAPAGDAGWAMAPETTGELRGLNLDVILALDRSDWSGEVLIYRRATASGGIAGTAMAARISTACCSPALRPGSHSSSASSIANKTEGLR